MISILMPTRKRPNNVINFWQSLLDTVEDMSEIELIMENYKDFSSPYEDGYSEAYRLYNKFNLINSHKMNPIPTFKLDLDKNKNIKDGINVSSGTN